MTPIRNDPDSNLVNQQYAIVFTNKQSRKRFPENCVEIVESREDAMDKADIDNNRFPAVILGPSRSSEGFRLYYLVEWLL